MTDLLGPGAFGAAGDVVSRPAVTPENGPSTPDRWFKDCTSQTVRDGTEVKAGWANAILAQMRQVVRRFGVAEDNSDDDMVARAVRSQRANWLTAGGTADAITLTPVPAFAALADLVGVPLRFLATADNAGPVTLDVSDLGAQPVKMPDGTALTAGALLAVTPVEVVYTGTVFVVTEAAFMAVPPARGGYSTVKQPYFIAESSWLAPPATLTAYAGWTVLQSDLGDAAFTLANGTFTAGADTAGKWLFILTVLPSNVTTVMSTVAMYTTAPDHPTPVAAMSAYATSGGGFAPHLAMPGIIAFSTAGQTMTIGYAQSPQSVNTRARLYGTRISN